MEWSAILYGGWQPLARTAVIGVLAYLSLVVMLRLSGKRTLSKFNAFDFVVTIALGSTLATALLSQQAALAQGVAAFAVLMGLQFAITWLSVRSAWVSRLVSGARGWRSANECVSISFRSLAVPSSMILKNRPDCSTSISRIGSSSISASMSYRSQRPARFSGARK